MKVTLMKTTSAYYDGPKTTAPYMLYAEANDKAVAVELDGEEFLPAALVKAGVNLHRDLHPEDKLRLALPAKTTNSPPERGPKNAA